MYGMVHTMIGIMYALNVLSRYGNKYIEFLKHLLKYCKYSKMDRLIFHTHDGPTDIDTMSKILQLRFQCDADLGGNLDNGHSQTSYCDKQRYYLDLAKSRGRIGSIASRQYLYQLSILCNTVYVLYCTYVIIYM